MASVSGQDVIFRGIPLRRYRTLFATPGRKLVACALAFFLAHLILGNWVAPVMGLLFARTYSWTRSLLLVTLGMACGAIGFFPRGWGRISTAAVPDYFFLLLRVLLPMPCMPLSSASTLCACFMPDSPLA